MLNVDKGIVHINNRWMKLKKPSVQQKQNEGLRPAFFSEQHETRISYPQREAHVFILECEARIFKQKREAHVFISKCRAHEARVSINEREARFSTLEREARVSPHRHNIQ